MHTPAQLHRRSRHTLTVKRHRLRRRTIQRLLQQRLLRRNSHKITGRTALLQLRIPRISQLQTLPARQKQLPRRSIQHHRLIPHHRDLQIPRTLQAHPRYSNSEDAASPSASDRGDGHRAGLRIGTVNPVVSPHRGDRALRRRQHRFRGFLIETIHRGRRQRPDLALGGVRDGNDLGTKTHVGRTRQLLVPAQAHVRRRNLVQRRTRLIINKHIPGTLENIERRTRRRHRTIKNTRRIIQPPHRVLGLTDHPHPAVVQLHLSGLEPRIDDRPGNQHAPAAAKADPVTSLLWRFLRPSFPSRLVTALLFP